MVPTSSYVIRVTGVTKNCWLKLLKKGTAKVRTSYRVQMMLVEDGQTP